MRSLWLLSLLILTSCSVLTKHPTTQPSETTSVKKESPFNAKHYREWQHTGDHVYWVNSKHSLILVNVFKGGALARLGHDHVIASHDVVGALDQTKGIGDFAFPFVKMTVDEPRYRDIKHLPNNVSETAREGTKHNMLDKVVMAQEFPWVSIHAQQLADNPNHVGLIITCHGVSQRKIIPFDMVKEKGAIHLKGSTTLTQTQFGIKPFSALSGTLLVEDEMTIDFDLEIVEQNKNNSVY